MSLLVNTNVSSINGRKKLFSLNNNLSFSLERLSSGFRIYQARDDAAGLQMSNRLTTQVPRIDMVVRNATDVVSLTQTIAGALQNRFQSAIQNLSNISEKVTAARSRSRDTHIAVETAEMARWQFIQHVSLTVLEQSNLRSHAALQ